MALALSNIFSPDVNFPTYDEYLRAIKIKRAGKSEARAKDWKEAKDIIKRADKFFFLLPAPFDPRSTKLLPSIDAFYRSFFRPHHANRETWYNALWEYTLKVAALFHETYPENDISDDPEIAGRAGARTLHYLWKLSGGIYFPTPRALEKTTEQLDRCSLGISQASLYLYVVGSMTR